MQGLKNQILAGETIELEGITMAEYRELCAFGEDNDCDIEVDITKLFTGDEDDDCVIVRADVINPENKERQISAYIVGEDLDYESAKIELTLTSSYYDWSNTVADKVNPIRDSDENGEPIYITPTAEEIKEYNKAVDSYNRSYGQADKIDGEMTNEKIAKIIEDNNNLI